MKSKISKSPSYLVRNPYTYCFRMNVPKDLKPYIGRKELRYSLKTGYLATAKYKARIMAGQVQQLFKLTNLLHITCCYLWASNNYTHDSSAANFHFSDGTRYWFSQSGSINLRVLPVRDDN